MSDHFDRSFDERAPEPAVQPTEAPDQQETVQGDTQAPEEPAQPAPQGDDEGEPPLPSDVMGLQSAVTAERRARNDWKSKAAAAEAQAAELRKQLEDFRKQAQQPPQQPQAPQQPILQQAPQPRPDPVLDPDGFIAWNEARMEERLMRERAEASLERLRTEVSEEDLAKADAWFHAEVQKRPELAQQLRRQRDPYGWAWKEFQKAQKNAEIGDDPWAWHERKLAEARAQWEAEAAARAAPAPQPRPASNIPPSLGTVRNNAPPGRQAWSGETPLSALGGKGFA